MGGVAKGLSPAAFVLTLVCFFLPFVTFSCQGQKVARFSGIQMVTGTTIKQPQMFGPPKSQKVDPEPLAVLAFLSVLAGAGLSFIRGKKGALSSGVLAVVGVILMAALKSKLDNQVLQQTSGAIQVNYGAGYYLSLVFLLAAAGASFYALLAGKGIRLPAIQGRGGGKFCTQCGARNTASNMFCKECGSKFE